MLVVATVTWQERWERMNPEHVLERKQAQQQRQHARSRQGRNDRAKQAIEQLFTGDDDMGRRLDIAPNVSRAMHQWGEWARRPQFWANLNVTPFCKLVGIGYGREMGEVKLDPQSMAIHKSVMRLQCEKTKAILYAYYVAQSTWSDYQQLFTRSGISEPTFHRLLKTGSVSAVNGVKIA